MKVKLLTTISFFTYQLSVSQTEKLLHGKVVSQSNALKDVDVINKTAKTTTTTNSLGEFSILVNVKDSLIFFSKDYFITKLKITTEDVETNNLVVNLILKPEELKEVLVLNATTTHIRLTNDEIKEIDIHSTRPKQGLKIQGYKEAIIQDGVDFIALGKQIKYLFSKEKEIKTKTPTIDFKELIATSVPPDFFSKDLKLNTEEKELFLQFCDADPKSKLLLQHPNILATMDFLYAKNDEFKKLK